MKRRKKKVTIHESLNKSRNLIKWMLFVLILLGLGVGFLILRSTTKLFNDVNKAEEEKIIEAINDYEQKQCDNEQKSTYTKCFVNNKVYLVERIIDSDGSYAKDYKDYDNYYYAYSWIVKGVYYKKDYKIEEDSGSSIPNKVLLGKKRDTYTVLNTQIPRDGNYYSEDMNKLFPSKIRKKINNAPVDGTSKKLDEENKQEAEEYFK